ncbi:MAG: DUF2161 family putative PD-(D/E)XK-type phosphodiesterase [Armatimonadota bacterium]
MQQITPVMYYETAMSRNTSGLVAETDLYNPIYDYLTKHGYTVRSEVMNCDVTAVKDDELIVIELKRAFNTALLIQATERQKITGSVYIALPYPASGTRTKQWKGIRHLLRRLEIGLIFVHLGQNSHSVEVIFHPLPYQRKKQPKAKRAVLREIESRSGDFNHGGSFHRKLVTAYRENAIHIACCLDRFGPLTPKQLRELGTGNKTLDILYDNHYGWFERIERGVYALRAEKKPEMDQFTELIRRYRAVLDEKEGAAS